MHRRGCYRGRGHGRHGWQTDVHHESSASSKTCYRCGGSYPHDGESPATSRRCHTCHQYGHHSKQCRNKRDSTSRGRRPNEAKSEWNVRNENESGSDWSLAIHQTSGMNTVPKISASVSGVPCTMYMDSGTAVDIMDKHTYQYVCDMKKCELQLSMPDTKLYSYGSTKPLPLAGMPLSSI